MAFLHVSAPIGSRTGTALSADNPVPERHIVIETLRRAQPLLGLSASVIATLDAMMSCLAPKRTHHTVFASNATLVFRRNGISDRTLRRHAALLQDAGLIERRDSPNKKRYSRHSATEGKALRFGFDLSPLFDRMPELCALAAHAAELRDRLAYLRCKLRAAVNGLLACEPDNPLGQTLLTVLRRKLSCEDCEALLTQLDHVRAEGQEDCEQPKQSARGTGGMTGNDGQNVRHHHNSNKEIIEKEESPDHSTPIRPSASIQPNTPDQPPALQDEPGLDLSVADLKDACPEAVQFSLRNIETEADVIAHARSLAPMIGIDARNYEAAQRQIGPLGTAMTVWAIVQIHDRVKSVGAYFRAITTGRKSAGYDPAKLIQSLAKTHSNPPASA